jgi:hypothetical protein
VGRKVLRESKDENAQRKVDYPSVLFGFSGVALVVLAISQSEEWGFVDYRSGIALVIGLILIGGFIRRCRVVESPLLDLSLFKLPFVVASNLSGVLFSVGFIGMWLLNTTWLQQVWDYSVVRSGLATFPGPAMAALVAPFAGKYATRLGHARVLFVGALMLSFGTFMLASFMTTDPEYVAHYLPWMLVTGIGVGLSISTLSSSATAFLPPSEFAISLEHHDSPNWYSAWFSNCSHCCCSSLQADLRIGTSGRRCCCIRITFGVDRGNSQTRLVCVSHGLDH